MLDLLSTLCYNIYKEMRETSQAHTKLKKEVKEMTMNYEDLMKEAYKVYSELQGQECEKGFVEFEEMIKKSYEQHTEACVRSEVDFLQSITDTYKRRLKAKIESPKYEDEAREYFKALDKDYGPSERTRARRDVSKHYIKAMKSGLTPEKALAYEKERDRILKKIVSMRERPKVTTESKGEYIASQIYDDDANPTSYDSNWSKI